MIFGKSDKPPAANPATNSNAAPAPAAMQAAAPEVSTGGGAAPKSAAQPANFRYVDRPDTPETFADSITALFFDGQTLRIEFAVTRVDEVKANTPITGRRYPACRVVLPPSAAVDLINRMQQVGAALTQAGVVKANPRPGEAPKT
jgi:hypothetical protein